jgi:hypothetical protein
MTSKQIEADQIMKIKQIEADQILKIKQIEAEKEVKLSEQQTRKSVVEIEMRKLELEQQHDLAIASISNGAGSAGGDRSLPARDVSLYRAKMSAFLAAKPESAKYNGKLLRMCFHCHSPRAFFSSCRVMLVKSSHIYRVICAGCNDVFSREIRKRSNWRQMFEFLPNPSKNLIRDAAWVRSNGLDVQGKCDACNSAVDFGGYHRAHDLARVFGGGCAVDNSFVSCAQCNVGSGVMCYSRVIRATRERLRLPPLADRHCPKMCMEGVKWMSRTKVSAIKAMACPWNAAVFSQDLRSFMLSSIQRVTLSF